MGFERSTVTGFEKVLKSLTISVNNVTVKYFRTLTYGTKVEKMYMKNINLDFF